jgi:hypothetical protein
MRTVAAVVVCVLAACDPGGSYHVPGAAEVRDNGARAYELSGGSSTRLVVRANWFTSSVDVGLSIMNYGRTPLAIRANELHLADLKGPLEPRHYPQDGQCMGHEHDSLVTLAPGETCEMFGTFTVHVDRDRLKTLTMTHDGITRDGAAIPISVTFELG